MVEGPRGGALPAHGKGPGAGVEGRVPPARRQEHDVPGLLAAVQELGPGEVLRRVGHEGLEASVPFAVVICNRRRRRKVPGKSEKVILISPEAK